MADSPMDLRQLGNVEDAEVVHNAVKRFRRRVLVGSVWVLVVILGVGVIVVRAVQGSDSDFRVQVLQNEPLNRAIPVYHVTGGELTEPVTVQLTRVTRVSGDLLALIIDYSPARQQGGRVLVYPPAAASGFGCDPEFATGLGCRGATYQDYSPGCAAICEEWLTVPVPAGREIPIDVRIGNKGQPVTLRLSLDDAKVPALRGEG